MPSPHNLSRHTAQTLFEHLLQNDVISEDDIYEDLNEEIADIIFSAITLSLKENK